MKRYSFNMIEIILNLFYTVTISEDVKYEYVLPYTIIRYIYRNNIFAAPMMNNNNNNN